MNKYLFIAFSFLFILSCKTKNISTNEAKALSIKLLQKNMEEADFKSKYFSAKAKVNFNDGKINQGFTANIRIKENEIIWMSLTGPFGIEGARILIEKNRIQILDKLNGNYYDENLNYLNRYLPFNPDLKFIENLLLGNSFQSTYTKQKINLVDNLYEITDNLEGYPVTYRVNPNYRYHDILVENVGNEGSLKMQFADYRIIENYLFAMVRELNFKDDKNSLHLDINFNKIKVESGLEFPFDVPEKYKNP
ncbi:MAG: DUF4292 domain-containing protein [Chitinophagales bacterium]